MKKTNNGNAPQPLDSPLLLDVTGVAHSLDLSVRTVWRLVSGGDLSQPVRIGRSARWERRVIQDYVEGLRKKT